MHRKVVLTLALVLGLASYAQAALSIVNTNHTYNAPQTVVSIPIVISGSDVVDNVNINIQIQPASFAAGVGLFPGTDTAPGDQPPISFTGAGAGPDNTTGDFTGNFMFTSGHLVGEAGSDSWNLLKSDSLSTPGANVAASTNGGAGAGNLLTLLVDLTGLTSGTWIVNMGSTNGNGPISFTKVVSGNQVNVPVDLSAANFSITLVPEPTSVVLGLFAAAGLGAVVIRKRRVRRA